MQQEQVQDAALHPEAFDQDRDCGNQKNRAQRGALALRPAAQGAGPSGNQSIPSKSWASVPGKPSLRLRGNADLNEPADVVQGPWRRAATTSLGATPKCRCMVRVRWAASANPASCAARVRLTPLAATISARRSLSQRR